MEGSEDHGWSLSRGFLAGLREEPRLRRLRRPLRQHPECCRSGPQAGGPPLELAVLVLVVLSCSLAALWRPTTAQQRTAGTAGLGIEAPPLPALHGTVELADTSDPTANGTKKPNRERAPKPHRGSTDDAGGRQATAEEAGKKEHEGATTTQGPLGSHDAATLHGRSRGYLCLDFLLGGLGIGCILQVIQERLLTWVPYTCLLFLMGVALSCFHFFETANLFFPVWYVSVEMWTHVNPHLVFYVFLPILIFSEAMRLDISLAKKLGFQVILLAGPGVVIGTVLTAVFSHYVFPYEWSWATSLVFGSILSATDPVAVVALFNTMGVSPRLTMLISGESLINDGTAIVLFTLALGLMLGQDVTPMASVQYALQMTLLAVVLGVSLACVGLYVLAVCTETMFHSDPMIQVCVTIVLSMLCFFIAESEVKTSGVITVVSAGCIFSHYAWPRFASRETIHIVWEAIEFFGNTVIFLLSGLLFGYRCMKRTGHLQLSDIGWLGLLWVGLQFIRGAMMLILWPLMNCLGERVTWKEALVITWSGLRGAVGLVLAIIVDEQITDSSQIGSRFMFHIGGIAMLTIMINATLIAPLLDSLGLTRPPKINTEVMRHFEHMTFEDARHALEEVEGDGGDPRWAGTDLDSVRDLLLFSVDDPPIMRRLTSVNIGGEPLPEEEIKLRIYRQTFMRYVQAQYWADIEDGLIPRTSLVARVLLHSASGALNGPDERLHDWKIIRANCHDFRLCTCLNRCIGRIWPLNRVRCLQSVIPAEHTVEMWKVYFAWCFIDAHKKACTEVPGYFAGSDILSQEVQEQVAWESQQEVEEATEFMKGLSSAAVSHGKSRMLAGKLLNRQLEKVDKLAETGILDENGVAHITHHLQAQYRKLAGDTVTVMQRAHSTERIYTMKFF